MDIRELQGHVAAWARATFHRAPGRGSAFAAWNHLQEEVAELGQAIVRPDVDPTEEVADVAMLVLDIGDLLGVDVGAAVLAKLEVNRGRTWGEPDEAGVVHHVKEEADRGHP